MDLRIVPHAAAARMVAAWRVLVGRTMLRSWVSLGEAFKWDRYYWQKGLDRVQSIDVSANTAAYSCVNILSQEMASLQIGHWRTNERGAREQVTTSAAHRVLNNPNEYQTRSDFFLYLTRGLLFNGAAYALAERNARAEIDTLHPLPPKSTTPVVDPDTGAIFYDVGDFGDGLFAGGVRTPARNVLALRINCRRHPLVGETPIQAYAASALTGSMIQTHSAQFFQNMGRPSGVIQMDTNLKPLQPTQRDKLASDWDKRTAEENIGKTPIMPPGYKWQAVTMSAVDAEIIDTYRMTVRDMAMAYRVPLYMLGDLEKATFRNTEQMFRTFYQSSLRFYLEHVEAALNRLFAFDGVREYVEFDIEGGLMRAELDTRMEAYAKGIQGGIFKPNEVRLREALPPVSGGDSVYVQQQMVPLEVAAKGPPAPAPPPAPAAPPAEDAGDAPTDEAAAEDAKALAAFVLERAARRAEERKAA